MNYQVESWLLALRQEKEKYALLVKQHAEIITYQKEKKDPEATSMLLLTHAKQSLDLCNKYVKFGIALKEKYQDLLKVVDQKNEPVIS